MSVINSINVKQTMDNISVSSFETITISVFVMLRMGIEYVLALYLKTCAHVTGSLVPLYM
jgi:hypothetical protein